jgi:hypothetical protein
MKIQFLGKGKMIGDVTYWAPPWWKFWQWKLRHQIIISNRQMTSMIIFGMMRTPVENFPMVRGLMVHHLS